MRELPANLIELLKKRDEDGAIDSELADAADLANLIVSSRVAAVETTSSWPPVSGVVARIEELDKQETTEPLMSAPAAARPPRSENPLPVSVAPRTSIVPWDAAWIEPILVRARRAFSLDTLSSSIPFALLLLCAAIGYALVTWLLLW